MTYVKNAITDYAASGSAQTTTGGMTSGSPTLTLASALDFVNGQGIYVAGAGAAAANLVTSILSGAGTTTLTLAVNAGTTVVAHVVQHDDTVAIQAMLNAGSDTFYWPDGLYRCNKAPTSTTVSAGGSYTQNNILWLPAVDFFNTQPVNQLWLGGTPTDMSPSVIGTRLKPTQGVIIQSDCTVSGASLIGGLQPNGSGDNYTNMMLKIRDITFRTYNNPVISVLNLSRVGTVDLDGVSVDVGVSGGNDIAFPTTAGSCGVILPANSNNANTRIGKLFVQGYYTGLTIGEHTKCFSYVSYHCKIGMAVPSSFEPSHISNLAVCQVPTIIKYVGDNGEPSSPGGSYLKVSHLDYEWTNSGVWTLVYAVDDVSNILIGDMDYGIGVLSGFGWSDNFPKNGGTKFITRKSGTAASVATSTVPTFTAATVSNLVLWVEADFLNLTDGTLVSSATDYSGTATSLLASAGARPTLKSAIVNGRDVLRFNGSANSLQSGTISALSQPMTYYIVLNPPSSAGSTQGVFDGKSTNRMAAILGFPGVNDIDQYAGTDTAPTTFAAGWQVWEVVFNGASSYLRKGSAAASSAVSPGSNTVTGFTLGSNAAQTSFLTGDVAAILAFNKVVTPVDRQAVYNYLAAKYAL